MTDKVSDEMLMAFVDGELDAKAAGEVRRAIAGDATLDRRAEAFQRSRELARSAFGTVTAEPVPDRLIAAIMTRPSGARGAVSRPVLRRMAVPLAASITLLAGLGGYLAGQAGAPGEERLLGGPTLAEAVGATMSGEQRQVRIGSQDVSVMVLATYAVDGGLCRTFEARPETSEAVRGIGCGFGEAWHIDVAVALPATDGFAPAASGSTATLDAYLDALGAEGPLDPGEEAPRG